MSIQFTECVLTGLRPEDHEQLQPLLFKYGFAWPPSRAQTVIVTDKPTLYISKSNKTILYSAFAHGTVPIGAPENQHVIAHHHLGFLQQWLDHHGLKPESAPVTDSYLYYRNPDTGVIYRIVPNQLNELLAEMKTEHGSWICSGTRTDDVKKLTPCDEEGDNVVVPTVPSEDPYFYYKGTAGVYRVLPEWGFDHYSERRENGTTHWEQQTGSLSAGGIRRVFPLCDKDGNLLAQSSEPTPTPPRQWLVATKGNSKWPIFHYVDNSGVAFINSVGDALNGVHGTIESLCKWPLSRGFTIHRFDNEEEMKAYLIMDKLPTPQPLPEQPDPEVELHEQDNETTTETPTQPMTQTTQTPYDLMINDVVKRATEEVRRTAVTDERLRESIIKELAKQNKLSIVIEDRRKDPVERHEPSEAHHCCVPDLIGEIQAENSVALVGPTGSGKTLGVLQVAKILGIGIICIKQMTRIIAPHDLIGFIDANGNYRPGAWTDAILGHHYDGTNKDLLGKTQAVPAIIVVDEMDNANENIIMLLKGLKTGRLMMPYGMQEVNPRLIIVATMNTWGTGATREYVGRCAQDAALLNEFMFIEWGYDTGFEWELLQRQFNTYKETGDYTIVHMRQLLDMFIAMRGKAATQNIRVIISTRNIIDTAKSLICNPQQPIHKALVKGVYKGLKAEDIKRVECPEIFSKRTSKFATVETIEAPVPKVVPGKNSTFGDTVPVERPTPKLPTPSGQDISTDDCPI